MSAKISDSSRRREGRAAPPRTLDASDDGAGSRTEAGNRTTGAGVPDARAELERLADGLRESLLTVAWRQWRALGAGAAGGRPSVSDRAGGPGDQGNRRLLHTLVDPEALVLVSLLLADHERRLGDLLHAWGARNSDLLSVQRMKNLKATYPEAARGPLAQRLAWFATVARDEGKDLRWRSLAQGWSGMSAGDPEETEGPEGPAGSQDEAPAEAGSLGRMYGAHAPRNSQTKVRAARVRLVARSTLMLRLRLGFGVGVKADLVTFLLARAEEWATVRDIADATGYTVAAVRRAAEDMAEARLIESRARQPAGYRATRDAWVPLLGLRYPTPGWGSWHERFRFAIAFLHWAEAARERPLGAYAFGVQGRQLLEQYHVAFERDLDMVWSSHSAVEDWGEFVGRAVRSLGSWMEETA